MQADTLEIIEQLLKGTAPAAAPGSGQRTAFEDRFEAELVRLVGAGGEIGIWEEESLLSALGAAGIGEFELACAFLDAVHQPPSPPPRRDFRRLPIPVPILRQRFDRLRAEIS